MSRSSWPARTFLGSTRCGSGGMARRSPSPRSAPSRTPNTTAPTRATAPALHAGRRAGQTQLHWSLPCLASALGQLKLRLLAIPGRRGSPLVAQDVLQYSSHRVLGQLGAELDIAGNREVGQ